jgi:hypothetical protein
MIEVDDQFQEIDSQFYTIHHQDGWGENNRPWLVCCGEEFDAAKHDSYTRFSGWNCPNETAEISAAHPPKDFSFVSMKIDSL